MTELCNSTTRDLVEFRPRSRRTLRHLEVVGGIVAIATATAVVVIDVSRGEMTGTEVATQAPFAYPPSAATAIAVFP